MKTTRRMTCAYIYTDGTLVQMFEEERKGIKIAETVDITRGYCRLDIGNYTDEHRKEHVAHGRLVLHLYIDDAFVALAKGGRIEATLPSTWNGSENSRSRGLAVQYVKLTTKSGMSLHWTDVTTVISSQFTVQEITTLDNHMDDERLHVGFTWGGNARIWKITDLRPKPEVQAA